MTTNTYDIGDQVRLECTVAGPTGTRLDPETITLKVRSPRGVITTFSAADLQKDAVGAYHCHVDATESGTWVWRVECAGAAKGAEERRFFVNASAFA